MSLIFTFSISSVAIVVPPIFVFPKVLKGQKDSSLELEQKKQANEDIASVAKLFDPLKNNGYGSQTILENKNWILPSSLFKEIYPAKIGFEDPSKNKRKGVNVSFEVLSFDDSIGELKVAATISKNPVKTQIVYFTLKGYQASEENANKDIANVAKLFDPLINNWYENQTILENRNWILPSSLFKEIYPAKIGFEDPSKNKRKGVNVSFEVVEHYDSFGELKVAATISKNPGKTQIVYFTLKGYQARFYDW